MSPRRRLIPSRRRCCPISRVTAALEAIKADDARTLKEQIRITEIPAPPFKENLRGNYILSRFQELGFKDAVIDAEGNVIARRKGTAGTPKLVISAHQDTVFPEGTDVTVKEKDGVYLAPGIGDDARGLAALLSLMQTLNTQQIATVGDVMFVASVGEEELGNLRGVKALFRDNKDIDGFISIDGLGVTRIVNQGTGSHRYEMIFKGPGRSQFSGIRPAERDPRAGSRGRENLGAADTRRSENHLHGRNGKWRHIRQRHRSGSTHDDRHAIEFDRRTVETRSEASRSGEGRSW